MSKKDETVWKNRESGKTYVVVSQTADHVVVKRLSDGKQFNLATANFKQKYETTKRKLNQEVKAGQGYIVVEPDPQQFSLEHMVLHPETVQSINVGIARVTNRDRLEQVWNISRLEPEPRTILNFYGEPGTGKTLAAKSIASGLNKPMLQADYAQLVSCFHGQTAKHLQEIFLAATEHNAVLFFDEADTLVSKRLNMNENRLSIATAINQERNAFMQELDRFNGIVIMATNFFKNFDEAMLRRVAQHVHFKRPNKSMRITLFKNHIPNMGRVRDVDWDRLGKLSLGLSGGDIFQVVVNAINAVSLDPNPDNWWLTEKAMLVEIKTVLEAKMRHGAAHETLAGDDEAPAPIQPTPPKQSPTLEK